MWSTIRPIVGTTVSLNLRFFPWLPEQGHEDHVTLLSHGSFSRFIFMFGLMVEFGAIYS